MIYKIDLSQLRYSAGVPEAEVVKVQALIAIAERLERLVELGEARQSSEDLRDTVELYKPSANTSQGTRTAP